MEETIVNVKKWVEENQDAFLPPVCNKLMHRHQLNVMFVGGPNQRKDYHIEEGEELFYQLKGDMYLKIVENGKQKDIHIKEGEARHETAKMKAPFGEFILQFLSPGLVQERLASNTRWLLLGYYVGETTNVLFEKWFYCDDLGTQLVPIIQEFFNSSQYRTGKPNPDEILKETPFPLNNTTVMEPFSFQAWLNDHREDLVQKKSLRPFGDNFETEVVIYGPGISKGEGKNADIWIWQMEGTSVVVTNSKTLTLESGDSLLIPVQMTFQWKRAEGSIALSIVQDPVRKRPYA